MIEVVRVAAWGLRRRTRIQDPPMKACLIMYLLVKKSSLNAYGEIFLRVERLRRWSKASNSRARSHREVLEGNWVMVLLSEAIGREEGKGLVVPSVVKS